jgi:ectoine hydroxylase-related dioxygenase (phytanoyl-CoA dioxygenase family)
LTNKGVTDSICTRRSGAAAAAEEATMPSGPNPPTTSVDATITDFEATDGGGLRRAYHDDGVVLLPQLLDAAALELAEAAFRWSLDHPGPAASRPFDGIEGAFYQDLCNPAAPTDDHYRALLDRSPLAAAIVGLWGTPEIWFMYEQVFLKEGGESRRTPWHQDAPYLCVDGDHLAVAWITFDTVPAADSLEFVRGSHRQTLYNTSAFDPDDETAPLYDGLPRLPDIEADRARFDIVSFPIQPGDVVVFHPAMLHGGAPTHAGSRRRTLTLRFFGRDATYVERPGKGVAPMVEGLHDRLVAGAPFRDHAFPELTAR